MGFRSAGACKCCSPNRDGSNRTAIQADFVAAVGAKAAPSLEARRAGVENNIVPP